MKIKKTNDERLQFFCEGCGTTHAINSSWKFNGNYDKPTISPSVLVVSGHYMPEYKGGSCWCTFNKEHPDDPDLFKCMRCHSFITDGNIRYLSDSTHKLAGNTITLLDEKDWDKD